MDAFFTKADILKDLKTIYQCALRDGNWQVALQATKLRGQHIGLFDKQQLPKVVRIADMTEEQLTEFINRLEKRDPTLKDQKGAPARRENLPEKTRDGKEAGCASPDMQGEAEPENPADPADFAPAMTYGLSRRQEESVDNLHLREETPAEDAVLPHRSLEWEKPPPCYIWSVS